jgi:carboxyl-terminal processing protease
MILRRFAPLLAAGLLLAGCAANLPFSTQGVLPPAVVVADASPERRALNERTYDAAVGWVESRYYDRNLRGVDWAGETAARREAVVSQPTEAAFYGRMSEVFDLLDDRHTSVTSPTARAREHDARGGRAGPGFGLTATRIGDEWRVVRVSDRGPAMDAGVLVGWRILSVDGERELNAVTPEIGQAVAILFEDEDGVRRTLSLTAEERPVRPPFEAVRRDDGVLVLRFDRFDVPAVEWLEARVAEAVADPPRAVILDLRENSGGLLAALGDVVALLHDERVAFARQNGRFIDTEYVTRPNPVFWSGPVYALIGPGSGSAAEVLAAHLQEADRGEVVGERSAGAVVASRDVDLPDGGVMSVSLYVVLTALERRSLEGVGVTPDLLVEPTLAERRAGRDVVLDAAVAAALASD